MTAIFQNGVDKGYKEKSNWWSDVNDPDCFRISTGDDYPQDYFKQDHVSETVVENYCNNVIRQYELFTGKELVSIVEFGSGGGWFTKEFNRRGYMILGFEGSASGILECERKKVWMVTPRDFRYEMTEPMSRYDIALCTEIAGHIEPPFSAVLVNNLIKHSDLIWWSSEEPSANKPHLHHPNEQPYQYWINLFEFYGYGAHLLSEEVYNACEYRGRYIFYNKSKYRK